MKQEDMEQEMEDVRTEVAPAKKFPRKQLEQSDQQGAVIWTENQVLNMKLDKILAKLEEFS